MHVSVYSDVSKRTFPVFMICLHLAQVGGAIKVAHAKSTSPELAVKSEDKALAALGAIRIFHNGMK